MVEGSQADVIAEAHQAVLVKSSNIQSESLVSDKLVFAALMPQPFQTAYINTNQESISKKDD